MGTWGPHGPCLTTGLRFRRPPQGRTGVGVKPVWMFLHYGNTHSVVVCGPFPYNEPYIQFSFIFSDCIGDVDGVVKLHHIQL